MDCGFYTRKGQGLFYKSDWPNQYGESGSSDREWTMGIRGGRERESEAAGTGKPAWWLPSPAAKLIGEAWNTAYGPRFLARIARGERGKQCELTMAILGRVERTEAAQCLAAAEADGG